MHVLSHEFNYCTKNVLKMYTTCTDHTDGLQQGWSTKTAPWLCQKRTKNVHNTYQLCTHAVPVLCQGCAATVPKTQQKTYQKRTQHVPAVLMVHQDSTTAVQKRYQKGTKNIPKTYTTCTNHVPMLCQCCAKAALLLYQKHTKNVPKMYTTHTSCTDGAPRLPCGCTKNVPKMYKKGYTTCTDCVPPENPCLIQFQISHNFSVFCIHVHPFA